MDLDLDKIVKEALDESVEDADQKIPSLNFVDIVTRVIDRFTKIQQVSIGGKSLMRGKVQPNDKRLKIAIKRVGEIEDLCYEIKDLISELDLDT